MKLSAIERVLGAGGIEFEHALEIGPGVGIVAGDGASAVPRDMIGAGL